ncbi:hypothetical protein KIW84_010717 [Lathyrus oleraceus]|uniref:Uncharacterized protein n=1 Tax=Pisum sativum TaxID=3888 RepID=A0A9D4YKU0_PEA|nr:hypothetical protein KIW84_010717 [Pisum sativum]
MGRLSFLNQAQGKLEVKEALVPSESEFFFLFLLEGSNEERKKSSGTTRRNITDHPGTETQPTVDAILMHSGMKE